MAIFHLKHSFLKRGTGASSVAKAAYNSGEKIEDNKGSTAFSDYTRKGGVLYDEITLPAGSPKWANNRGELWRRLEKREDQSTRPSQAILAHNFDVALPHELTLEQNIFLAKDFVREQFTRNGYAVDWSIHSPDPRGDDRNIHLHILVPLRKIVGESYGKKARYTRGQLSQQVKAWRRSWATLANRHLKRYGHNVQIDARTLKAQGIKRTPTRHHGSRVRVKGIRLNKIRPPQPKSPSVKITTHADKDGIVKVRATIKHSALAKINVGNRSSAPVAVPSRKGWPPAAIRDWEAWGKNAPAKFFTLWRELAPNNFAPKGGLSP
jgi:hypothetical protein